MVEGEEELPQLKELYEELRRNAAEIVKDLSMAKRVYRVVGMVSVVFGAVPLALGIASIVLTMLAEPSPLNWSYLSMVMSMAIGLTLIVLGGILLNKSESLERKYGKFEVLKKMDKV
jgi:hypothetical protein